MNASVSRPARSPLVLLLLALIGCGGGGSSVPDPDPDPDPDPSPPRVLGVFPKDLSARSGSQIRFIAELDKQASSYLWSFGDGATPVTATTFTDLQPLVILGAPGTYTGTLTVCAASCADPFAFTYTVTPNANPGVGPNILSISPTGTIGKRGEDVTFTAEIADGVDEWLWTFGGGTTEPASTLESPTMHLIRPGVHQGTLRARLSGGGEDLFGFVYEVLPGVANDPPIIDLISNEHIWACDQKPLAFSATVLSDFPITYEWSFPGSTTPAITTNSVARVTTIPPEGHYDAQLIVRNQFGDSAPRSFKYHVVDCPDLNITEEFYPNRPQGPHYIRLGHTGKADHTDVALLDPGSFNQVEKDQLEVYWAQPGENTLQAQAWRFNSWGETPPVEFTMTTAAPPGPLPLWQKSLSLDVTAEAALPQVAFLQGRPAVLFVDREAQELRYAIATSATPISDTSWDIHTVGSLPDSSGRLAFTAGDGRPVAAAMSPSAALKFFVADRVDPTSEVHWQTIDMTGTVPILWETEAVGYAPDGRLLIVGKEFANGVVSPMAIQTLVPHPTSSADIGVVLMFPSPPEALHLVANDVVNWRGRWMFHLNAHIGPEAFLAAAQVPIPLSADDWTLLPLESIKLANPVYGDGRFLMTSSRLWLFQDHTKVIQDAWGGFGGSLLWWTSADQPLAANDWQFAGSYPNLALKFDGIGTDVDGRMVVLSKNVESEPLLQRALLEQPNQGSDWYKLRFLDSAGQHLPINARIPVSLAVQGNQVLVARQGRFVGPGLEIWWTDLTW